MPEVAANSPPSRSWLLCNGDGPEGLLGHGPVDHTFLDGPYAEEVEVGSDAIEVRDNPFGFKPMDDELRNRTARAVAMQTRRWALIFCSLEETHLWRFALIAAGMTYYRTGAWVRENTTPQMNGQGPAQSLEAIVIAHSRTLPQRWNGGGKRAFWHAPIERTNRIHPTQKPTSLLQQLVLDFTDPGELIADPFAGAATTGVAAVGLGRRFVGWELDTNYYKAAFKRLDDTPLLDRPSPEQIEIIAGVTGKRKGAAAKARMEFLRTIHNHVMASGHEGVQATTLAQILDVAEKDVIRGLNRLKKGNAVIRKGRTSSTRWFATTQENSDGQQAAKRNP